MLRMILFRGDTSLLFNLTTINNLYLIGKIEKWKITFMDMQEENFRLKKESEAIMTKVCTLRQEVTDKDKDVSTYKNKFRLYKDRIVVYENQLIIANDSLTLSNDKLQKAEQDRNIFRNTMQEQKNQFEAEKRDLKKLLDREKQDADYYYTLFKSLETKVNSIKEKYIQKLKNKVIGPNADFRHLINFTIEKLDSLLV